MAILPELLLTSQLAGTCHVETRPIDPPLYRDLGMALRAGEDLSPALDRFIKCVKAMMPDLK